MYLKDKTVYIALRIPKDLSDNIDSIANKMHSSRSNLLRFIIKSYIISLRSTLNANEKTYINNKL